MPPPDVCPLNASLRKHASGCLWMPDFWNQFIPAQEHSSKDFSDWFQAFWSVHRYKWLGRKGKLNGRNNTLTCLHLTSSQELLVFLASSCFVSSSPLSAPPTSYPPLSALLPTPDTISQLCMFPILVPSSMQQQIITPKRKSLWHAGYSKGRH